MFFSLKLLCLKRLCPKTPKPCFLWSYCFIRSSCSFFFKEIVFILHQMIIWRLWKKQETLNTEWILYSIVSHLSLSSLNSTNIIILNIKVIVFLIKTGFTLLNYAWICVIASNFENAISEAYKLSVICLYTIVELLQNFSNVEVWHLAPEIMLLFIYKKCLLQIKAHAPIFELCWDLQDAKG